MTDDIVTQLKEIKWEFDKTWQEKMLEAAHEIERLRKEVKTWIICAEILVDSHENEAYEKALAFYSDCQRIVKETCK